MKRGVDDAYNGRPAEPVAKHHRPEQGRFSNVSPYVFERLQSLFTAGLNPNDLEEAAVNALASLNDDDAASVLDRIAVIGPQDVRNKTAFICERSKRIREANRRREGDNLPDTVLEQLQRAENDGMFGREGMDSRNRSALRRLPLHAQYDVLDDFFGTPNIRNPNAFLASLISKKDQRHTEAAPHRSEGRGRGRGRGGRGGRGGGDGNWAPGPGAGGPQGQYDPQGPYDSQGPYREPEPRVEPMPVAPAPVAAPVALHVAPAAAPAPIGLPAAPATRTHQGLEQLKWGVRVDEFLTLSPSAAYVHPAAALRMQQLWDGGNPLLSLLDDRSFEALSYLDAKMAVDATEQTAAQIPSLPPDDIAALNSAFMGVVARLKGTPAGGLQGLAGGLQGPAGVGAASVSVGQRYGSSGGPQGPVGGAMSGPQQPAAAMPAPLSDHPLLGVLPLEVRQKLAMLFDNSRGVLSASHFDRGVVDRLMEIKLQQQLQVVEDLMHDDLASIRNPSAYVTGIVRRYSRGVPSVRAGKGRHGSRGPLRKY